LSDPATVERVFKLQRDEPFTSGDYLCVGDLVSDLMSYTSMDKDRAREIRSRTDGAREDLAQPEPKDKFSRAWRIWKLRQVEHAFGPERMDNPEAAYSAAHAYYRELLRSLFYCEDFYRTDFILRLLPELISLRQELDEADRHERRMLAGMKGAETRKARAAKKGGA
jgi:hypothetical protein